jgi:RNA polymerase sigma factor (sigma-70 family)
VIKYGSFRVRSIFSAGFDFGHSLASARVGDLQARGELLERCVPYLRAAVWVHVRRKRRPHENDPDLVQMTVLRALQSFPKCLANTEREFLNWLLRILLNLAATLRLQRKRRPDPLEACAEPVDPKTLSAAQAEHERDESIVQALALLDNESQHIVVWRHFDQQSWETIGKYTGRSPDSARMANVRALHKLAHVLAKIAPELIPHLDRS